LRDSLSQQCGIPNPGNGRCSSEFDCPADRRPSVSTNDVVGSTGDAGCMDASCTVLFPTVMANDYQIVISPTPRRLAVQSILGFWVFYFALNSVRTAM